MKNCIFCDIVAGRGPKSTVYEDGSVLAMMDIRPATPGHIIVIPRAHFPYLADLPEVTWKHMALVGMHIAGAIRRSELKCDGINMFYADGEAAGQEIFHSHLHVIPRYSDDGFEVRPTKATKPRREELDRVAGQISKKLSRHS